MNRNRSRFGLRAGSSVASALVVAALCAFVPLLSGCPKPDAPDTPSPSPTPTALTKEETQDPILPSASPSPDAPKNGGRSVSVYQVVVGKGDHRSHLQKETVPVKTGENPAVTALNDMAAMKDSPLPKGTRAQSVDVANGTATVNFNQAFADNFAGGGGGDDREALIFNAITATLGQFEGVKQVQILVDGKKVAIGGTQDTTEPMPIPDKGGTKVALKP